MKTKFLSLFASAILLFSASTTCLAVGSPISDANDQLRYLFQYVPNPNPNVKFFYQLGAHIIDSAYFDTQCTLTTNCDTWFYAYKELGWCAYNTNWMESDSSIYVRACDVYSDTVTFGIIDWEYNSLIDGALSSDTYFGFDVDHTLLYPHSDYSDAFEVGEIFMSSPLVQSSHTMSPVYKLDPSFVSADPMFLDHLSTLYRLYIDFDDGNGPQWINLSTTTYHPISYANPGYHVLTTTIRLANDTSVIIKRSNSGFMIGSIPLIPDYEYADLSDMFTGLKVYQFSPNCTLGGDEDKIIFVLSGYNPKSFLKYYTRSVSDLYQKYIVDGHREVLRDFGYTFVIVEWEDANRSIETNAAYVMNLIEFFKCNKTGDEQFVLIGESMGALVGRYALAYMESSDYVSPNDCCLHNKHNVRLFISNDGPHLGANIPLSIQEFYSSVENDTDFGEYLDDFLNIISLTTIDFRNRMLNGASVKQMLLYHYSTRNNGYYTAHQDHDDFLDEMANLGFPSLCKNVALSNGSLLGYNQQNCFNSSDAGSFRIANDDLLEIECMGEFHIFGFSFNTYVYVDLKTNPNGSGPLFQVKVSSDYPTVSLYWFGMDISKEEINHVSIYKYGYNLIPYCVSAGGAVWGEDGYSGGYPNLNFGSILLGFWVSSTPGSFSLTLSHGIPWVFGGYANASIHTDGFGFCLVPVQSAFCYDQYNSWNLQRDYTVIPTTTMFSSTQFDVLSGIPSKDEYCRYNGLHENYRNETFINQITDDTLYYYPYIYTGGCSEAESRILNREVGDEELFLDNGQLQGTASYSAFIQLYVNVPHPYYNFDGQVNTMYKIPGFYCRTAPFTISGSGYATFQSLEDPDAHHAIGQFETIEASYVPCCETVPIARRRERSDNLLNPELLVYPNPVQVGEDIQINSKKSFSSALLYDLSGTLAASLTITENNGTIFVTIPSTIRRGQYNLALIEDENQTLYKLFVY